jgi:hypothetical protein
MLPLAVAASTLVHDAFIGIPLRPDQVTQWRGLCSVSRPILRPIQQLGQPPAMLAAMRRASPRMSACVADRPLPFQLYSSKYNHRQKKAGLGVLTTYRRGPAWPESAFWASRNSTVPVDGLTIINLVNSPSLACTISGRRLVPSVCLTLDNLFCRPVLAAAGKAGFTARRAGWSIDHKGQTRGGSERSARLAYREIVRLSF